MINVPVTIHPLFWFMIAVSVMTGHFWDLLLLFIIVLCHELGHFAMARAFSWRIRTLTLLPFGGVMEVDEHGNRSLKEEALVILAGPFQHLWLIGLSFLLLPFFPWWQSLHESFVSFNVMILFFNLLPIWPLDGGKLFFLLFAMVLPYKRAHRTFLRTSFLLLIVFLFLSFYMVSIHLNLLLIIGFLLTAHYVEWKQHPYVMVRFALERYTNWGTFTFKRTKTLAVDGKMRLDDVLKRLFKGVNHRVFVQNQEINEYELLRQYFEEKKAGYTLEELALK